MRIVSLLPAATEMVAALGLTDSLVGVSHECEYPPEVNSKPRHPEIFSGRFPKREVFRLDKLIVARVASE